ncbi:unnamed protein product [Adineta steineri]|uniref:Uncharacterized protein n=1 Tax=Adineta steineri TaxID=433720 RepID=A0A819FPN1_9BILA|nr:unnamed protein product [Adineta steineri]CAF3869025.1 unnamed protein product [Adineta steineri]
MANRQKSSSVVILSKEIDQIIALCTHINQMATNLRVAHLSNISYATENIETCYETLLSMAEDIEGSALLLETLLPIEQKNLLLINKTKSKRIHYTRDELLERQKYVTSTLKDQVGNLLKQVVDCESNDSVSKDRQSWRDIRTILM